MTDAKTNEEPSIEEILGSIRRIIADDEDQDAPASPTAPVAAPSPFAGPTGGDVGSLDEDDDEEPLELTQKVDEDGTVIDLHDETEDEDLSDPVTMHTPINTPFSPASDSEIPMVNFDEPSTEPAETLVSTVAADATAAVMAKLARNTAVSRSASDTGSTLEDLVKDMLRPMLREWLDDNLPEMVQSMVERELERISRRVG